VVVLPSYNGARRLPVLTPLLALLLAREGLPVLLHGTFGTLGMNVLLSRGLEGEVAADPRRLPRYDGFVAGAHQVLAEQQGGTASEVPGLPAEIDVDTTARYTEDVLAGRLPVPPGLTRQVEHIVRLADQIR
jgi:anthranilate phosphoribosyltransferase